MGNLIFLNLSLNCKGAWKLSPLPQPSCTALWAGVERERLIALFPAQLGPSAVFERMTEIALQMSTGMETNVQQPSVSIVSHKTQCCKNTRTCIACKKSHERLRQLHCFVAARLCLQGRKQGNALIPRGPLLVSSVGDAG